MHLLPELDRFKGLGNGDAMGRIKALGYADEEATSEGVRKLGDISTGLLTIYEARSYRQATCSSHITVSKFRNIFVDA